MKITLAIIGFLTVGVAPLLPAKEAKSEQAKPVKGVDDITEQYAAVKGARMFTIGGIGYAGTIAPAETAFRKLIKGAGALAHCQSLLKEGSPPGRLYGLLGLKLLDKKAYEAAASPFLKDDTKVESASGCLVFQTTVAKLAKEIAEAKLK